MNNDKDEFMKGFWLGFTIGAAACAIVILVIFLLMRP
jgi:hypothetical protein